MKELTIIIFSAYILITISLFIMHSISDFRKD